MKAQRLRGDCRTAQGDVPGRNLSRERLSRKGIPVQIFFGRGLEFLGAAVAAEEISRIGVGGRRGRAFRINRHSTNWVARHQLLPLAAARRGEP